MKVSRESRRLAPVLLLMVAMTAGIGPANVVAQDDTASPEAPKLVILVTPNPTGGNTYMTLAKQGMTLAAEQLGVETKTYESTDPETRTANVDAAIKEGADIIVTQGFEFLDIVPPAAEANPDIRFVMIETCPEAPGPNVYCSFFDEKDGAYLAGVEAALLSKAKKVGVIGPLDIPFLHQYTDPFVDGAKSVDPAIEGQVAWVGGDNSFNDPARAKEQALAMIANGVDVIYAAAVGGNGGIFQAAGDRGVMTIGEIENECGKAPGVVYDNVELRADAVSVLSIDNILKGGDQVRHYGLADGAVALTSLQPDAETSGCEVMKYPDVLAKLQAVQDDIVNGRIEIKDYTQG